MRNLGARPRRVNSMLWYYENKGSIELVVDLPELCRRDLQSRPWIVRVPKKMLQRSLARMR
jgi:hypothetical protein